MPLWTATTTSMVTLACLHDKPFLLVSMTITRLTVIRVYAPFCPYVIDILYSMRRSSWRSCTYFFIVDSDLWRRYFESRCRFLVHVSPLNWSVGYFFPARSLCCSRSNNAADFSSGCMYTHFWNLSCTLPRFSAVDWMAIRFIRCCTPLTHSASIKFT